MKPLYIVAVSGGVDSIVLLDRLVRASEAELVVAHVDHGIRAESHEDALFVERLASSYGLPFESIQLRLGPEASEQTARDGRWRFLRAMRQKFRADKIVTAHHSDDVMETMMINILRGTGWRGIASLRETDEIKRPLLGLRKKEIIDYAQARGLPWREDTTNQDISYLRNRIRSTILPRWSDQQRERLMELYKQQCNIRQQIEKDMSVCPPVLRRYDYIMWPDDVARELLRQVVGSLTRREFDQALLFIRTARPHKQLRLSNGRVMTTNVKQFIVSRG